MPLPQRQFFGQLPIPAGSTATITSPDQTNSTGAVGVRITLDMTAVGTGSRTLFVEAKDRASGQYITLLQGAAVTTNSTNQYQVFPGATAVANQVVNDCLPECWRLRVVANNGNACTFTLGWALLS